MILVYEVGKLMDDILGKIPTEEKPKITYTIYSDKRERETSSTERFGILMKNSSVVGFKIWLRSFTKNI